jgi:hypothetical protein
VASEKQIAANRRNATKSTGPRSHQGKARSRMNALRRGSSSRILFDQNFIAGHLDEQMAAALNAELDPIRQERVDVLTALDDAILSAKATTANILLRKLRSLERRERAILQSSAVP